MKKHIIFIFIVFISSLLLLSCGKSDLSRSDAESQLLKSQVIQNLKTEYRVNEQKVKEVFGKGLFEVYMVDFRLADVGKILFEKLEMAGIGDLRLTTKKPSGDVELSVTGLIEGEFAGAKVKEAQFNWSYKNVPEVLRLYAIAGGKGAGYFRLYDDGWRLEEVKIEETNSSYEVSESEKISDAKVINKLILEEKFANRPKLEKDFFTKDVIPGVSIANIKIGDSLEHIASVYGKPKGEKDIEFYQLDGTKKSYNVVWYMPGKDDHKYWYMIRLYLNDDKKVKYISFSGDSSLDYPKIKDSTNAYMVNYGDISKELGNLKSKYLSKDSENSIERIDYNHDKISVRVIGKNTTNKNIKDSIGKIVSIGIPEFPGSPRVPYEKID